MKYYLILFISVVICLLIYSDYQKPIPVNNGNGYDGQFYYEMSEKLSEGNYSEHKAPYNYRIGTPYLASLFKDKYQGFYYINLFSSLILILLVFEIGKELTSSKLIALLSSLFYLFHWLTPLRYHFHEAVGVDLPALIILFSLMLLMLKKKDPFWILLIATPIVVLFREISFVPAFIYLLNKGKFNISNKYPLVHFNYKTSFKNYLPFILGLIVYLTLHLFINKTNDYNTIHAFARWFYHKSIIQYLTSSFIVLGPLTVILFYYLRSIIKSINNRSIINYLLIFVVLSFVGGSDQERFITWILPFIIPFIIKIIIGEKLIRSMPFNILFWSVLILSMRMFFVIPADELVGNHIIPIFTYNSNHFDFLDLYVIHGESKVTGLIFYQYLIYSIVLSYVIYKWRQRHGLQKSI